MNQEQIEGNWDKVVGKVQQKWGKLTKSDLEQIKGKKKELVGKIIERHGIEKEKAEREVDDFFDTL
jgi:uncharacterized protein YjbJ (UPF0337 family)